ncbi:MAG: DUF1588 domain-containing protein [Lentisphaerales bacterium]|nr:DUF1588 domain-containing protein [Lentisphaerales bacterium]
MLRYSDFLDEFLEEFFNPQKSQKVSNSKSKINTKEISKRVQITQGGIYRLTTVFNPPKNVREARVLVSVSSYPRMKSHPVMLDRKKNRKVVLETALYKNDSYLYQANIYKKENLIASSYLLEGPIGKMAKFKSLTGCETGSEMSIANGLTLLKKVLPLLYSRNTKNELTKYKREISVNKQSPDDAAKKVIKRALLSIEFLYGVDIRKNGQLSDISIAKRMARMLWRSVPDLQLLKLAVQKKLSNPLVRRQQSLRMMQDPRFGRFKKDFFTFWLGTREFYSRENPTKDAFPEFYKQGESLVLYSLYEQFNLYLNDLVDNNRSIVELIGSNWTYANDLINKNYRLGIKNMGSDFKRVQLSEESLHGGLLTQGVLMRLTSSVNDSSPVKRGVWILENFLAVKVPSPPPVAGFEPDIVGAKSLKEQFMMHREHKSCASCHEKIDPIGFLFESLGPLGKERKSYPLAKGKAAKIDREPMVFNGVTFKSINEFKKYILKHAEETIVKSYMEKLVTYSFGRSQDFSDKLTIKSILKNNPQFKVRDLIRDFCTSSMFVK